MKNNGYRCLLIGLLCTISGLTTAQTAISIPDDLKLDLCCRLHVDAGVYGGKNGNIHSGKATYAAKLSDIRLGVKVTHDNLMAKLEGRFDNSKASITDTYIRYSIGKSSIQIGNCWMPFGFRTLSPSYHYIRNASVDDVIDAPSRKTGILVRHTRSYWKIAAGLFSDGDVNNLSCNKGVNVISKTTWRPICDDNKTIHVALSTLYTQSPQQLSFKVKSLTQGNIVTFIEENIDGSSYKDVKRLETEAIMLFEKLYLEGCFQNAHVNMYSESDKMVNGFFVQSGWLIFGERQRYNKTIGYVANLERGDLEVSARLGYVNFMKGWQQNTYQTDVTVGLNYAFNSYIMLKLNVYHSFGNSYSSCELRTQVVI